MAEATNTGGNQSGTGSQNDGGTNQGGKKKIAGKWDTIEEAVEQGYAGLEKGFGEMKQQIANLVTVIETAMTPDPNNPGSPHVDTSGQDGRNTEGGYGRPGDVNAADFLVNPNKYLDEREQRLEAKITKIVGNAVNGAMAVGDFKSANPDLVIHEKIVRTFMADLDPKRPLSERLAEAGKQTREFLARVKAGDGQGGTPPKGNQYVETPRGDNPPGAPPAGSDNQPQTKEDEEKELADYIRDRQKRTASHFGAVEQK